MKKIFSLCLLLAVAVLGACDAATAPGSEPTGVVFLDASGREQARFDLFAGDQGSLTVPVGSTSRFTIRAYDRENNLLDIDGDDLRIRQLGILIPRAASLSLSGTDQIVIEGLEARRTSIQFEVYYFGDFEFFVSGVTLQVQ